MPHFLEHTNERVPSRFPRRRVAAALLALFALAIAIALPGNSARRPLTAHEAFVARTAVEMQRRGEYVVPYFNSELRIQKPPLSYWFAMLASRASGEEQLAPQDEFKARLPSIVLGAATVVLTAFLGWIVFDSWLIGILGGLLLATNMAFLEWARSAQPEMAYSFGCALFLLATAWARRAALAGRGTWPAALCAWTAVAIAILIKGPIIPVLLIAGAAIGMRKRAGGPGLLRTLHVPAGVAWMLVLVLPYFALVAQRVPGAIEYWRSQMFDRTGGLETAWWQPLELFYVGQAIESWMPWSALLLLVAIWLWRWREKEPRGELDPTSHAHLRGARFLGWCAVVPCIALSFSAGRKGYYLLPMVPAMGLLMAWVVTEIFRAARERPASARGLTRGLRAHALFFAALALGLIFLVTSRRQRLGLEHEAWVGVSGALAIAACLAMAGFVAARRRPELGAGLLVSCAAVCAIGAGASGVNSKLRLYTDGQFARDVARATDATRPLLVVHGDSQVLLYYTDRVVTQIRPQDLPSELVRNPPPWIVDQESNKPPGRVIVRERRAAGEDAMVLVDPTQDPDPDFEPPRGTR